MFKYTAVLFAVLGCIQSTFGGYLHGESYSAIAAPAVYSGYAASAPYAKLAAYSSPLISAPLTSTYAAAPLSAAYAARYASHSGYAAPLTSAYAAAPIGKYTTSLAAAPLSHATYAAAPLQSYSSYASPLIAHGSYADAAPFASYGGSVGGYAGSLGGLSAPLATHGSYNAVPYGSYGTHLAAQQSYGSLEHAAW